MATQDLGHFDRGTSARITGTFTDTASNTVVDPDNVYFEWSIGNDTPTTWHYGMDSQLTKSSVGVYVATLSFTEHGYGRAQFYGTGNHLASKPLVFVVDHDAFGT